MHCSTMRFASFFAHFILSAYCTLAAPMSAAENKVDLPFGSLTGNLNMHAREFLGIPFADPTTPRFRPPFAWTSQYPGAQWDATKWSAACMQPRTAELDPTLAISEDCLYLNVFTPRLGRFNGLLPVLFWIHGGGLEAGSAMEAMYNGSKLAATANAVVVAINYRLNVFGFMPVQFADGTITSNNGFQDQRLAMQWVADHIGSFGGDKGRVTIFGESAVTLRMFELRVV